MFKAGLTGYGVGMPTKREMAEYIADLDLPYSIRTREELVALHLQDTTATLQWRYDHYRQHVANRPSDDSCGEGGWEGILDLG